MKQFSFRYKYEIGQTVFVNVQGGKPLTIIDVVASVISGVEYHAIDSEGIRDFYTEIELSETRLIEM